MKMGWIDEAFCHQRSQDVRTGTEMGGTRGQEGQQRGKKG